MVWGSDSDRCRNLLMYCIIMVIMMMGIVVKCDVIFKSIIITRIIVIIIIFANEWEKKVDEEKMKNWKALYMCVWEWEREYITRSCK